MCKTLSERLLLLVLQLIETTPEAKWRLAAGPLEVVFDVCTIVCARVCVRIFGRRPIRRVQ